MSELGTEAVLPPSIAVHNLAKNLKSISALGIEGITSTSTGK